MHILIVYCHPEPGSFNGALKNVAAGVLQDLGHTTEIADLYAEGFDPAEGPRHYDDRHDLDCFYALAEQRHASKAGALPEDVRREIMRLEQADLVIFQFPLWWHAQPAMLKGWFDRVFVAGGLYTSSMRYDQGYFRGKRAICSVTTGAPDAAFGLKGRGGNMEHILWPMQYSLHYMGFAVLPPFVVYGIQGHGFSYRQPDEFTEHLEECKAAWAHRLERLDDIESISFPGWEDWDDAGAAKSEFVKPDTGPVSSTLR